MSRLDRTRLENCPSMLTASIPIRYDDLDVQNHVNNAAAVVMLQEARLHFHAALQLRDLGTPDLRVMVVNLHVEYSREMTHPGTVEISTGVLGLGRTSFTLGQVARQHGQPTIYAETTVVMADANGLLALPDDLRAACQPYLIG